MTTDSPIVLNGRLYRRDDRKWFVQYGEEWILVKDAIVIDALAVIEHLRSRLVAA